MTVAIIGSRDFNNYHIFQRYINAFRSEMSFDCIISGGARGADSLAEKYAHTHNIKFKSYLADWEMYGNRAGFIRNKDIIENADYVIAFWDEKSKGTLHSINLANKLKKKCTIIYYNKLKTNIF